MTRIAPRFRNGPWIGISARTVAVLLLVMFAPNGHLMANAAPAPIRINSGSTTSTTLIVNGATQAWSADNTKWTYGPTSAYSTKCPIAINSSVVDELYCTERLFLGSGAGYKIPVPQAGRYTIRLLFAETFFSGAGNRIFNVFLQGTSILSNLDLYKEKGSNTAFVVTRFVNVPSNNLFINIGFQSIKDNAKVNAIEIRYSSKTPTAPAPVVPVAPVPPQSRLILSPPLRINAGATTPFTDNLNRLWSPDQFSTGGAIYANCPTPINNTSPQLDSLYCTEQYATDIQNLTYIFPMDNFVYEVTLFFEELVFTQPKQRVFDVAIQGEIVISNLDIVAEVGYRKPYSRGFNVPISNKPLRIDFIHKTENAKISGIEIVVSGGNKPPTSAPTARVKAPIRINSGSTAAWTDPISKAVWSADAYYVGGWTYGSNLCDKKIIGTELDTLACSERYFENPGGKYVIPIQPGLYVLKLLFVETLFSTPAAREFKVFVNGQAANKKLDIIEFVGPNSAYIVSRSVPVSSNETGITIEFQTFIQNAKINAIEILDYNSRSGSSLEAGQTIRTEYGATTNP